jgi:hypothetical protein
MRFCGSNDIGTASASPPATICPHRPLRLCDIVTHPSVTMSSHNLQNGSPVENRSRPGLGHAGAVGVSPTCRLIRETSAVVRVLRLPRHRRGAAQAVLRPIADGDPTTCWPAPAPHMAADQLRHAASWLVLALEVTSSLKANGEAAGELLGLNPPPRHGDAPRRGSYALQHLLR